MSQTPGQDPDGRTPRAPDVDQPDGGAHAGEDDTRRAPAPDVDQPDGGGSARPGPA